MKNILILKHSTFSEDIQVIKYILLTCSLIFEPGPEIEDLLPILSTALHSSDMLTISYAANALSHLLMGDEDGEIMALDSSIAPTLVQLMMHSAVEVVEPALTQSVMVGRLPEHDDSSGSTLLVGEHCRPSFSHSSSDRCRCSASYHAFYEILGE